MNARIFTSLAHLGAYLAAAVLVLMFLMGLAEIVARSLLGTSLSFSVEIISYMLLLVLFWGSGWAMVGNHHISMNLVLLLLPERLQAFIQKTTLIAAALLSLVIFAALLQWTWGTYVRGDLSFYPLATPLWIPQLLLSFGPLFLFCGILARLLDDQEGDEL